MRSARGAHPWAPAGRSQGQTSAGVPHRCSPRVDGRDDLLRRDALQISAGRRTASFIMPGRICVHLVAVVRRRPRRSSGRQIAVVSPTRECRPGRWSGGVKNFLVSRCESGRDVFPTPPRVNGRTPWEERLIRCALHPGRHLRPDGSGEAIEPLMELLSPVPSIG